MVLRRRHRRRWLSAVKLLALINDDPLPCDSGAQSPENGQDRHPQGSTEPSTWYS
jgi:hypothetical protein